jgi:hypothetical protein
VVRSSADGGCQFDFHRLPRSVSHFYF